MIDNLVYATENPKERDLRETKVRVLEKESKTLISLHHIIQQCLFDKQWKEVRPESYPVSALIDNRVYATENQKERDLREAYVNVLLQKYKMRERFCQEMAVLEGKAINVQNKIREMRAQLDEIYF